MKTRYEQILEHHGIKGQKWGVRRFRNEDGSLTPAGRRRAAKDAKQWYKQNGNEILNKHIRYDEEYDQVVPEGKARLKAYQKEIDKMMDPNWDNDAKAQASFHKAEESYLRGQAEYSAKKLLAEYGEEKLSIYANRGRLANTGKTAVQTLSDDWWAHAI